MQSTPIYADYNGSAPLCPQVKSYLIERLNGQLYSNPNAYHKLGQELKMTMENARSECAESLGCLPKHIFFNSGSTEGISHIFFHLLDRDDEEFQQKKYIVTSQIEHSAVVNCIEYYEQKRNLQTLHVRTLPNGVIDLGHLEEILSQHAPEIAVVSIMAANNETGVIEPYKEIGELCQTHAVPFMCDTTQLIGKAPFNFLESKADYAFLSGHKIGAPTGSGIILVKNPRTLRSFIIGGGQERNCRGGTQNYLGNETLAVALKTFSQKFSCIEKMKLKREEFESKLLEKYSDIQIFGYSAPRLAGSTFMAVPGLTGSQIQQELEKRNIFVTTSSACSDGASDISRVLKAMGVNPDVARGAVRISLGLCSPIHYYDIIFDELCDVIKTLQNQSAAS